MFRAACIQLNSQGILEKNMQEAFLLIDEAKQGGAKLVALPENTLLMLEHGKELKALSPIMQEHPAVAKFKQKAKESGLYILLGSLAVSIPNKEKMVNRSLLFGPEGGLLDYYDKIHLFDANPANGEVYNESNRFMPGDEPVVVKTSLCSLGMTICYDLRFPGQFRTLAKQGAECISIPAAFTYTTGVAHWHVLTRARAIETGSYILAPAQCGHHPGNRKTYGHSLIIDPWGTILAEAEQDVPQVIYADIDLAKVREARSRIPAWLS